MRIVLSGGGTGGHISPLVALAQYWQQNKADDFELHYLGDVKSLARYLDVGVLKTAKPIMSGKWSRFWTWHNLVAPIRIGIGLLQSIVALSTIRPQVVLSTGGHVALPVTLAAGLLRIPLLVHEQTAVVGSANRVAARFAKRVMVSFTDTQPASQKYLVTGNPVRPVILQGNKIRFLKTYALRDDLPVLLVLGGMQGCHFFNQTLCAHLAELLERMQLILVTGQNDDYIVLRRQRSQLPETLQQRCTVLEFLAHDLGDAYAAANLVLARAGAGTVAELMALRKPAVLVPLPQSAHGEQERNAGILARWGAARVYDQNQIEAQDWVGDLIDLVTDARQLERMQAAYGQKQLGDAFTAITAEVELVAGKSRQAL